MNLPDFQQLVTTNADWFRGTKRESLAQLHSAEEQLNVRLPSSLKWLLSEFGYWRATGIGSLTYCVYSTLWKRPELPTSYVVLAQPTAQQFDLFHAQRIQRKANSQLGFIVLKTDERTSSGDDCAVYWARGPRQTRHDATLDCERPDCIRFESFAQFISAHLQFMQRQSRDEFIVNPIGWSEPQTEPIPLTGDVRQTEAVLQFLAETIATPISNIDNVADGRTIVETVQKLQALRRYQSMKGFAADVCVDGPKSSSNWRVVKPADHLYSGRLLASPLTPDCRPLSSAMPPRETWVAVVENTVSLTPSQPQQPPHLMSWIPPAIQPAIESGDCLQGGSFWISERVALGQPLVEAGLKLR